MVANFPGVTSTEKSGGPVLYILKISKFDFLSKTDESAVFLAVLDILLKKFKKP